MIERKDQKIENTWDLTKLYKDSTAWDLALENVKKRLPEAESFKGKLGNSSDDLYKALCYLRDLYLELENLGSWAFLNYSADGANPEIQKRAGMIEAVECDFTEKLSYFDPELLAIDEDKIQSWMQEDRMKEFVVYINKSLRFKSHVLSDECESLLSLYSPLSDAAQQTFQDLNNIDLDFGEIDGEKLTHSSYSRFMQMEDEKKRESAYRHLYGEYEKHQNTISRIYSASIKNDIFLSKARKYQSSLDKALFPDNVPQSVYLSLIESVHNALPTLHRYYAIRAKLMGKDKLKHWDVYLPLVKMEKSKHTYDEAVALIKEAVAPLGKEYQDTLIKGLTTDRWVDRYENKAKRSGAFSAGGYASMPYILTNFEEDVLRSVFTLIHEGGHSMHSYYSARNNPFMSYNYTIFEAEVASTFNENLLFQYLIKNAKSDKERAGLIAMKLDDIVATLFRQTMFAEFELLVHQAAEKGIPCTPAFFRGTYRKLLESYFGPIMEFEDVSDLEGLRIPHFYRAFYCYKYATGISASIVLSNRVLNGGEKEKSEYLSFLSSGGSEYPIDSLKKAGVDMSTPKAVEEACDYFKNLLDQFENLVF